MAYQETAKEEEAGKTGSKVLDIVETIITQRKDARKKHADWRDEARELYRFYSGDQWPSEDKAKLEETHRPMVTFNRVGPFIDAIVGQELNDRKEVRYLPGKANLEISHHYGLHRFREFGAVIIDCVNRDYCKKLIQFYLVGLLP